MKKNNHAMKLIEKIEETKSIGKIEKMENLTGLQTYLHVRRRFKS